MAYIRDYAAASGDPGLGRFFRRAFKVPRAIRKFHPSGLVKGLALGALTLPFGGAGLFFKGAGMALRGGGGLARLAGRGAFGALRAGGRVSQGFRSGGTAGGVSQLEQVAAQYGVDPQQLMQLAVQYGLNVGQPADDGSQDDTMDEQGDPAPPHRRAVRARHAKHQTARQTHGPGVGAAGGQLAALAAQLASGAAGTPILGAGSDRGIGGPGGGAGGRHGHNLMLLPGHKRRCRVSFDRSGQPYCAPKRMNVANVHALNRSARRLAGFQKLADKANHHLRAIVARTGAMRGHSHGSHRLKGHKSGCGCVSCRHK
jgi:hypothetical protein